MAYIYILYISHKAGSDCRPCTRGERDACLWARLAIHVMPAAMPGARCLRAAQLYSYARPRAAQLHCVVAHGPRKFRPWRTPTGGAPNKPFARLWAAQTKTIALAYGRRRLATSRSPMGGPTTWRSPRSLCLASQYAWC